VVREHHSPPLFFCWLLCGSLISFTQHIYSPFSVIWT
jgi:hypothetical protein